MRSLLPPFSKGGTTGTGGLVDRPYVRSVMPPITEGALFGAPLLRN